MDLYLFTNGLDYAGALSNYIQIGGKIPIPRRHMLGLSWSRWGMAGLHGKWDTMNQVGSQSNRAR